LTSRRLKYAFSLTELLVVIAILAFLTAVLFPVFKRVEDASRKAVCANNFHQVSLATRMYMDDYEGRFMPVSDTPGAEANSRTDRTWVQVVLPYVTGNLSVFHCPSNPTGDTDISTFDQDLVPGDTYSEFYTASLHVNTGYNYQYLAPVLFQNGEWVSQPRLESEVRDNSRTILFVDSKWSLTDSNWSEGGSWLVAPPCRYVTTPDGKSFDTFLAGQPAQRAFVFGVGWNSEGGVQVYGGAWPWHMGRMTVAHVDGSIQSMTPGQLAAGCSTSPTNASQITDPKVYAWDPF
jgi:prepilin-type N-terminal cleavage/methylation domain-containing protein